MGRQSTAPVIIESLTHISTGVLQRLGYLQHPSANVSGVLRWTNRGQPSGAVGCTVLRRDNAAVMVLSYTKGEQRFNYSVSMFSAPSNLGKGLVWFFVCPVSGKRCRKLYGNGKFMHRTAIENGFYDDQLQTLECKAITYGRFGRDCKADRAMLEIGKKHFKRYYAGKPTKRYTALLKKADLVPEPTYELYQASRSSF